MCLYTSCVSLAATVPPIIRNCFSISPHPHLLQLLYMPLIAAHSFGPHSSRSVQYDEGQQWLHSLGQALLRLLIRNLIFTTDKLQPIPSHLQAEAAAWKHCSPGRVDRHLWAAEPNGVQVPDLWHVPC